MKLSPVSGCAGAVRVQKLNLSELRKAERHGKRLDATGKSRAVFEAPPVTTTGPDLEKLYKAHVADAFVPTAKAIAIHVLVQLPKNLIDGENPDTLLKYARGFVETVFGSHAIFADRVDRDEKGRTNVDLFVTPKYLKRTKHTEKLAVSMTRDLKAVADKYGRKQHKWDTGRALQDALYDYLKNTVGLEGVKRGEPKKFAGSDWETAEQLRMEELAEKERQIEAELRRARAAAAKAEHDGILLEQSRAEAERIVLEADERARIAMQEQERTNHEVEDIKAALKRQEDELAKRTAEVAENGRKALVDAEASRQNRIATEAALAEATAHREARQADRETDAQKRALHQKQLALVARASDDANGLDLRIASNTFTMSSSKMTEDEKVTQATKWPDYIIAIARTIATTLQKLRDMAASLAQRELVMAKRDAALDKREAELKHNQATYAADRAEHEKRLVQFNVRTSRLTEAEKAAEKAAAKVAAEAQKKLQDAEFDAFVTKAEREEQNKWFTAMQALEALSEEVSVSPNGRISVTPNAERALPAAVADLLKKEPPEWATWLVGQRHDLAAAKRKADESTQAADAAAQELAAMIEQAGPLLTPAKKPIVSEAQQVLARHGFPPPDFGV